MQISGIMFIHKKTKQKVSSSRNFSGFFFYSWPKNWDNIFYQKTATKYDEKLALGYRVRDESAVNKTHPLHPSNAAALLNPEI